LPVLRLAFEMLDSTAATFRWGTEGDSALLSPACIQELFFF